MQKNEITFDESIHIVDPAFFDVFDFPLLRDAANPLQEAHAVVLTPETAARYFGEHDPVGQTLSIRIGEVDREFFVTGVTAELPRNSSIQFTMAVSWAVSTDLYDARQRRSWGNVIVETYVLLKEGVFADTLETKFPLLVQQEVGDFEEGSYTIGLQPMRDIHLNPDFPQGLAIVSDPAYSYILSALALLVLSIACINVVTLSVARSTGRTLEVGIRKVVGAERVQLMQQFWGESGILALLALIGGVLLAWIALPFFNNLINTNLTFRLDPVMLLLIAVLGCILGFIAGSYPALILSKHHVASVLKGSVQIGERKSMLRQGLIVAQFAFAVFLIASTLIMSRQLQFLQTKNLGFDKEQVVVIPMSPALQSMGRSGMAGMDNSIQAGMDIVELFKQELDQQPTIKQVGAASFSLGAGNWFNMGYQSDNGRFLKFQMNVVDPDFLETLGMELVSGRNFAGYATADARRGVIVNETLAAAYGWEDPIGQQLPGPFGNHEIIGVVRDFHFQSLHTEITPALLVMNMEPIMAGIMDVNITSSPVPKLFVRLASDSVPAGLDALERVWDRLVTEQPFTFSFLDAQIDSQYRAEQKLRQLVIVATLLSIFIACLGVFGLAALMVARRNKEIGIRKVLGASVHGIVLLLSKDFARLILIAFLAVAPAVYLVMDRWLQDFAYRIGIGPGVFVLSGVLAMVIALLTVSFQSIKAAMTNPVDSLRSE